MKILVLNSGSSSQKSALYEIPGAPPAHPPTPAWQGKIEWNGDQAEVQVQNFKGVNLNHRLKIESRCHARLAFEMVVHRLQSGIGAMIAVLDGIDALIFTAGIGENSPEVRAAACANFGFLDLKLDGAKNAQAPADQGISFSDSSVRVLIIRAQEDWAIAHDCWRVARGSKRTLPATNFSMSP